MKFLFDAAVNHWETFGLRLIDASVGRMVLTATADPAHVQTLSTGQRRDAWLANIASMALTAAAASAVTDNESITLETLTVNFKRNTIPENLQVVAVVQARDGDLLRCEATFSAHGVVTATGAALFACASK